MSASAAELHSSITHLGGLPTPDAGTASGIEQDNATTLKATAAESQGNECSAINDIPFSGTTEAQTSDFSKGLD